LSKIHSNRLLFQRFCPLERLLFCELRHI